MIKKLGWIALYTAAMLECPAMAADTPQSEIYATIVEVSSKEPDGRLNVPDTGCVLVNNVWDPSATPAGFSQSVSLEKQGPAWERGGVMLPGWQWNAPGGSATVLSMPEIVCGDKPWDEPLKLRPEFPFVVGEKRLSANFDVDLKAEGRYNMAFSLWAVSKLPAVQKNISLEIMVWNVASRQTPAGEKIGTIDAAGTTFDIYLKKDQGMVTGPDPFTWPLVQFVARTPLLKGTIDFGPFLDELMNRRILTRGHRLTSLELGTEIWEGTGSVSIRRFELSLVDSPR